MTMDETVVDTFTRSSSRLFVDYSCGRVHPKILLKVGGQDKKGSQVFELPSTRFLG